MGKFNNFQDLLWTEKHYNNDPGDTVCCLCGKDFYLKTITAIVKGDRKKLREMGPNGKTIIIGFVDLPLCDNCIKKTNPHLFKEIKKERNNKKKTEELQKIKKTQFDEKKEGNKTNKKSMFLEWEFYLFMFFYYIHVQVLAVFLDLSGKMGLLSFAVAFTLYYLIWYQDKKVTLKKIALTIFWVIVAHIGSVFLGLAFFITLEILLMFF